MKKRECPHAFGLLPRMEARLWKDKKTITYRYKTIEGKQINLGTDRQQAILKVAQMNMRLDAHGSLNNLWILYQSSPGWKKLTDRTKSDYTEYSKHLLKVFGMMHIAAIRPTHIAQYLRDERASAPVRANREIALLSNLAQLAIDHGLIDTNPCKEVRRNTETPRDILPSTEVLSSFLQWLEKQTPQRKIIAMAAEYASLAGNRQIEFLDLTWSQVDFDAGVIQTQRAKQRAGKKIIDLIDITPRMQNLLLRLKSLNRDSLFLFPNKREAKYTSRGFKSMWQKSILSAISEGVIKESDRFAFHDLRAYYTTQHKNESGRLPDLHANPATTARIYERSGKSRRSAL